MGVNVQYESFRVLSLLHHYDDFDYVEQVLAFLPKSTAAVHTPIYEAVRDFAKEQYRYPEIEYLQHLFPDYQLVKDTGPFSVDILANFLHCLRKEVKIQEAEKSLAEMDYETALDHLREILNQGKLEHYSSDQALEDYETQKRLGSDGIYSGISCLDEVVRGFRYGTTCTVAAPPSMFKTTFAVNLCYSALVNDKKCVFITLEIPKRNLMFNFWARHALHCKVHLPAELLHKTSVSEENFPALLEVVENFKEKYNDRLFLIDQSDITGFDPVNLEDRLLKAREHMGGLDLVALDYIQLVRSFTPPRLKRDSTEFVNGVINHLNALAQSFCDQGFFNLLLSQVNREGMKNMNKSDGKKGLSLESLAEFNALDRVSHIVAFLFSSPVDRMKNTVHLQCVKNRNGPVHPEPVPVQVIPESMTMGFKDEGSMFSMQQAMKQIHQRMEDLNVDMSKSKFKDEDADYKEQMKKEKQAKQKNPMEDFQIPGEEPKDEADAKELDA